MVAVKLIQAKKPVILADSEYENGKIVSRTERIEMVDDNRIQLDTLDKLWKVKGHYQQKKKDASMKDLQKKIFITVSKAPGPETHPEEISWSSSPQKDEASIFPSHINTMSETSVNTPVIEQENEPVLGWTP